MRVSPPTLSRLSVAMLMLAGVLIGKVAPSADTRLPGKLDPISAFITLTPEEVDALTSGRAVTKAFDGGDNELRLFGAIWIDAPEQTYLRAVANGNDADVVGGRGRHRISDPPREQDVAALHIPDADAAALRDCQRGDCALKVTDDTLRQIREINWSSSTSAASAQALMRTMALSVVTAYRKSGNAALGVYVDDPHPVSAGREVTDVIREMPLLDNQMRQYLLSYPNGELPKATSHFEWQLEQFGLKPTLRINHIVIVPAPDHVVVVSKQIYASHYIRAALDVREFIPDPARGEGFWLVDVSVARVDGFMGLRGHIIHQRARSQGVARLEKALQSTKLGLETTAIATSGSTGR